MTNLRALAIYNLLSTFLLLGSSFPVFAAPVDIDFDGRSDPFGVVVSQAGELSWRAIGGGGEQVELGVLGAVGDHLVPGSWRAIGQPIPGVVSKSVKRLLWKLGIGSQSRTFSLGTPNSLVVGGADFNLNGLQDAAVVSVLRSGRLLWEIQLDAGVKNRRQRFVFGRKGDRPFFYSPDGGADRIALMRIVGGRTVQILSRPIDKSAIDSMNIRGVNTVTRTPIPIISPDNRDALILQERTSSGSYRLIGIRSNGKRFFKRNISGAGTILIGDYEPGVPGEEVIYKPTGGGREFRFNPWSSGTQTISLPSFIPVDEININSFSILSGQPQGSECELAEPRDGFKSDFIWKPNSDTQFFAVVVLPARLTGLIKNVEIRTSSGKKLSDLLGKGAGNGNRTAWQDRALTGADYQKRYGEVVVRAFRFDGGCLDYFIDEPASRVD